ncbi:MAG: TRAP transporter TatT component family protein [Myxococcota bacterium]|nr:TRAP transporter TatT component family protein [Myxococcota bacterium]
MKHWAGALIAGLALFGLSGCSMAKMAADSTVAVMIAGKPAVDRESDLSLARGSAEGNLMMMEGLREATPENKELWQLMAEAYGGYTFGFVEDDLESIEEDTDEWEYTANRAYELYRRGRDAAHRRLSLEHGDALPNLISGTDGAVDDAVSGVLGVDDVPALFWFAQCWSSMINLRQEDPVEIMSLGRVERLMERVLALDETFMDAGPHLFMAVLKSAAPPELSDETKVAESHFDRAEELTGGQNLMIRVFRARYLDVARRDRAAFTATLEGVLESDPRNSQSHVLVNTLAQRRARRYLSQVDDLFPPES